MSYTRKSWLWPDRTIGKKESRVLRDEHNALYNEFDTVLRGLEATLACLVLKDVEQPGFMVGQALVDATIEKAKSIINKAKGE